MPDTFKVPPPPSHTHLTEGNDNNQAEPTWNKWFAAMHDTLDRNGILETPAEGVIFPLKWHSGGWAPGTYQAGSIVYDNGWLMVCNKETTDRAAPQPIGDEVLDKPDAVAFSTNEYAGAVWTGNEYTFTKSGWVTEVQVWVPEVGPDISYRVFFIDYDDPDNPTVTIISDPTLLAGQWSTVAIGKGTKGVGNVSSIVIDVINSGASTEVTGGWIRGGNSNTAAPIVENWNRRNQDDVVRINHIDQNVQSRQTELESIIPGSTIQFVSNVNPAQSVTYQVLDNIPLADHVEYGVARISDGVSGEPSIGTSCSMTAVIPTPQNTKYSEYVDYYPGGYPDFATIKGIRRLGGRYDPVDNNAYGVRIRFQEADISDDWDLMAYSQF